MQLENNLQAISSLLTSLYMNVEFFLGSKYVLIINFFFIKNKIQQNMPTILCMYIYIYIYQIIEPNKIIENSRMTKCNTHSL